jgi:hypothetical protein
MGRNHQFLQLLDSYNEERSLRRAFYEFLEGLDAEAKRKAYFRARTAAIEGGYMDVVEGMVIDKRKAKS